MRTKKYVIMSTKIKRINCYISMNNASNSEERRIKFTMATLLVPELSTKNKYYIDKHRYYELKHFCLQYPLWKKAYEDFSDPHIPLSMIEYNPTTNIPYDPTARRAILRNYYSEKIELIENAVKETDNCLYDYILKAVTEGLSYTYLKTKLDMPCGRDMYYNRYRKFFWILNEMRK